MADMGDLLVPCSTKHLDLLSNAFPKRIVIPDTEHRAISVDQLAQILTFIDLHCRSWHDFFQTSPTVGQMLTLEMMNLYHLDAWLIRPATQEHDCSMVELLATKPQTPQWFISHWWGEPVQAFTSCVQLHQEIRQLPGSACYWVCAYANRQHSLSQEVSADPRDSSFFRALKLSEGVLLILDEATPSSGPATPFTRIWCAFEEFVALTAREGDSAVDATRMLLDIAAAEKGKPQLLTDGVALADEEGARRLGAGYPAGKVRSDREKSFPLEVLRAGLTLELEKAQASMEADRIHILNCIAGRPLDEEPLASDPSYDKVNQTLRAIFAVAGWRQAVERDIVEVLKLPEVLGDSQREDLVLDFTGSMGLTDGSAMPLARCLALAPLSTALRRLEVSCRWCPEISHDFLMTLAPAFPTKLEKLVLRFGFAAKKVHEEGLEAVAKAMPRSLTELFLDFADGSHLGDSSLKAIAESLPKTLEHLTLGMAGWVKLTDQGLEFLQHHLPQHLTSLKLDLFIMITATRIGDMGLASLASKLGKLDRLQTLDLSFKGLHIGDGGLSAIAAALPEGLRNLRLVLDKCATLTDAGLSALGEHLPTGLEKLQLFCNDCELLGDGALAAVGSAHLPSLKHLEMAMEGVNFTDAGLAAVKLHKSLRLLSLSLTGAHLQFALCALAQKLPGEVEALHLNLSNCTELQDLGLKALGEALPNLNSLTMSLDNCEKLTDQGLAGCEGVGDGGYAALAKKLPQTLRMLELEPGSSFSTAALATLRQKLLEMPELVLRLDCSYTQVDDELAADLIGAEALSALRRWQPSVTPAVAVAWSEVGELPTLHPAVAPAAATATTAATAPKVVEVEALKPKTLPDVKVKEALSSSSRRPSATPPVLHVANESAARLASNSRPASSSPLPLCGAQVLRQPPSGGLLQNARQVAKAKAKQKQR